MAISGALVVDFGAAFPYGAGLIGAVAPLADFDASTKENRVQARDKETGLPLWVVDVMDFDPDARERTFKVKIAAAVQPVPPEAVSGAPVRPVVLENMTVTAYVKETGNGRAKVAYSLRATGLAAPGRAVRSTASAA